jgi:hypothetical protein
MAQAKNERCAQIIALCVDQFVTDEGNNDARRR